MANYFNRVPTMSAIRGELHREAMSSPRPGVEESIVALWRDLNRCDTDPMLGPGWIEEAKKLLSLLDGDCGRIDPRILKGATRRLCFARKTGSRSMMVDNLAQKRFSPTNHKTMWCPLCCKRRLVKVTSFSPGDGRRRFVCTYCESSWSFVKRRGEGYRSSRELDAASRGPGPSNTTPPEPGERCPRCHERKGGPKKPCRLCNPKEVP